MANQDSEKLVVVRNATTRKEYTITQGDFDSLQKNPATAGKHTFVGDATPAEIAKAEKKEGKISKAE